MGATLELNREEFADAVRVLRTIARQTRRRKLIFSFSGALLTLRLGDAEAHVTACGTWPMDVVVPARFLPSLGRYFKTSISSEAKFSISVAGDRLWVEDSSPPFNWRDSFECKV